MEKIRRSKQKRSYKSEFVFAILLLLAALMGCISNVAQKRWGS